MRSSPEQANISEALAKAQAAFPVVPKKHNAKIPTKSGGEYSYVYADLADTVEAAGPVLAENGLAVTQFPSWDGDVDLLTTRLMHTSGEWLESDMRLFLANDTPQAHGSAITYARRYGYTAAIGIVADVDDDGAAATHGNTQTAPRRTRTRSAPQASESPEGEAAPPAPKVASEAQVGFIQSLFAQKGFPDDPEVRHTYEAAVIGHPVTSTKDLLMSEARQVITALQAEDDPEPAPAG